MIPTFKFKIVLCSICHKEMATANAFGFEHVCEQCKKDMHSKW